MQNGMFLRRMSKIPAASIEGRIRESSDLQRYSRRLPRARANRGAAGGRVHRRGRSCNFRPRARSLRRGAEAARRAALGAAGKSRDARATARILPALRLRRFSSAGASAWQRRQWAGLGYSNITPFNTPGEYSEEEIAAALAAFDGIKPLYLVVHFPPQVRARRVCPGKTRRQPGAARVGRARAACLSFLRPHPRNARA